MPSRCSCSFSMCDDVAIVEVALAVAKGASAAMRAARPAITQSIAKLFPTRS